METDPAKRALGRRILAGILRALGAISLAVIAALVGLYVKGGDKNPDPPGPKLAGSLEEWGKRANEVCEESLGELRVTGLRDQRGAIIDFVVKRLKEVQPPKIKHQQSFDLFVRNWSDATKAAREATRAHERGDSNDDELEEARKSASRGNARAKILGANRCVSVGALLIWRSTEHRPRRSSHPAGERAAGRAA